MRAPIEPTRDRDAPDALVTDRYLDALLAAVERRADGPPADATLDPGVQDAARVLARSLVRVHPSFRFEERLASRLAGLAASQASRAAGPPARASAGAPGGSLLAFPSATASAVAGSRAAVAGSRSRPRAASDPVGADPLLDAILRGDLDPSDAAAVERAARLPGSRRPLIGGVAITSAAISLVGVAWVAWRAAHPAGGTITRMARTDHLRRVAAAMSAGGLGGPA